MTRVELMKKAMEIQETSLAEIRKFATDDSPDARIAIAYGEWRAAQARFEYQLALAGRPSWAELSLGAGMHALQHGPGGHGHEPVPEKGWPIGGEPV